MAGVFVRRVGAVSQDGVLEVTYVIALLYRRPDSRYWWVQYVDLAGERRQLSTKFRYDNTLETRKAHELRRGLTLREQTRPAKGLSLII